mmetsp:Transcript_20947/g.30195  ORF Transcript_20947/g.30195 Transcript_20947/m.30195 type:complete len:870 (-) Transcript_20947:137-2746(-)
MPERVLLPTCVTPVHYALELTPDLELFKFDGSVDVDVVVSSATDEVVLHSKEIHVKHASFVSTVSGQRPSLVSVSYHLVDTTLTLKFDTPLAVGEGKLHIEFEGILNGDMAGFYKSSYVDADGKKQVMASTQFESLDARRAFPCWDEPALKATFTVSLVVPSELTALCNMPEVSTTHLPGHKKRVQFDVTPKMSTYLLAWVVGHMDYVCGVTENGVAVRVFCPPGRAAHGQYALSAGKRALDFFDEFFGVKYPLPKLDMIAITEFAMGAMENWGLVTYREVDLMIDEEKASSQQKQRVSIIVAHELAHQWFGNLVTMEWWGDLWLNEGFACYMEHFCTDALFPEFHIWDQYTTDAMGAALRLDALRTSHPIQVPIIRAEEVEQVFDAISYCKGSTVVRMVAAILGPDNFRKGLQNYMKKHQYSNTVTLDLWTAWADVSGIDIPSMMTTWTEQMGYPFLTVVAETWSASNVTIELQQSWFLADGSGANDDKIWTIPLIFATSSSESDKAVLMTQRRQTFTIPLASADDWLKINAGQHALVRVAHSPTMLQRLQEAIRSKSLSPIDRASLLLDSYALAKAGNADVDTLVPLLRAYDNEDSSTVWNALSGVLGGLNMLMSEIGGESYAAFKSFGWDLIKPAFKLVGWEAQADDSHSTKLLRATLISLLDTFGESDKQVFDEAKRRFDEHWENPSVLSSDFKTSVYKMVLRTGGVKEFERLLQSYYDTDDNTLRRFVMTSLGATSDPNLKLRALDWTTKSGDVKLQDFFYTMGAAASGKEGAQITWTYFVDNLEYIKKKLAKASPSLMDAVIINCASQFCTLERAAEVEDFFKNHPLPSSAMRIGQVVESIRITGSMLLRVQSSSMTSSSCWM